MIYLNKKIENMIKNLSTHFLLIVILFFIVPKGFSQNNIDLSNWKLYNNNEYGFEFRYPENYSLRIQNNSIIYLRKISDNKKTRRIIIKIVRDRFSVVNNEFEISYDQFIIKASRRIFDADGPYSTQYGDSIVKLLDFKNINGITGQEIFVNVVYKKVKENNTVIKNTVRGPIFIFRFQKQTPLVYLKERAIMVRSTFDDNETELILRKIIESFKNI